jgi:hypothetical protein
MDADSRSLVHSSQLSLFAAEVEVSRLSAFSHRPHFASLRIGLDQEVSHRIVAEPLGPPNGPRQDEEPIPLVMLEYERRRIRFNEVSVPCLYRSVLLSDLTHFGQPVLVVSELLVKRESLSNRDPVSFPLCCVAWHKSGVP